MTLAALDTLQRLALSGRHGPLHADLHQLGVAGDGVEWRAQLVAHDREKLALGAIRLFGQTPGLFRFTPRRALGAEESLPLTERRTQRRLELFTTPDLRFERLRSRDAFTQVGFGIFVHRRQRQRGGTHPNIDDGVVGGIYFLIRRRTRHPARKLR